MSPDDVQDLFSEFGPVSVRRMFSGASIYAGGIAIAIHNKGAIYLKVDEINAPDFDQEGLPPFTYKASTGMRVALSYRRMPDRLYDDPAELAAWARAALDAARRAAAGKGRPKTANPGRKKPRKR